MRAREFIKPQIQEERTDEFVQALAPIAMGLGRAAVTGAQMVGRGALAAGRMAADVGSKVAQTAGRVGTQVGKAATNAATSGIKRVGQAGVRQLGTDIKSSLSGKNNQKDPNKQQAQTMSGDDLAQVQQNIQQSNPNMTAGQLSQTVADYKQGKVDVTGAPITKPLPTMGNTVNSPAKPLDPQTDQTMMSAEKAAMPPGSTIQNDKLGPLQVMAPNPTDKDKGITVKVKNDPTLPPLTIQNKKLAQGNQQVQKDLGGQQS